MSKQRYSHDHRVRLGGGSQEEILTEIATLLRHPRGRLRLPHFGALRYVKPGDIERCLVRVRCRPCRQIVAELYSWDGAADSVLYTVKYHRETGTVGANGHPEIRYHRSLLSTNGDPVLDIYLKGRGAEIPQVFKTSCRVHGDLEIPTADALQRARTARSVAVAAESRGEEPRIAAWSIGVSAQR